MNIFELYNIVITVIMVLFCLAVVGAIVMMIVDNIDAKTHYEALDRMHAARAERKALYNAQFNS